MITRRSLVKGVAWVAPTIAVSAVAPAYAESHPCKAHVDQFFNEYKQKLPDLTGSTLRFWFQSSANTNGIGVETEAGLRIQNHGTATLDFSKTPLLFDIAVRHVQTSDAINSTLNYWKDTPIPHPVTPYPRDGYEGTAPSQNEGLALYVDQCPEPNAETRPRRPLTISSSYVSFYKPGTNDFMATNPLAIHSDIDTEGGIMECISGTEGGRSWQAFGVKAAFNAVMKPGEYYRAIAYHFDPGDRWNGVIYATTGYRLLGFAPPSFEDFKAAVGFDILEEAEQECYLSEWLLHVETWLQEESLNGGNAVHTGWAKAYTGDGTDGRNLLGDDLPLTVGEWTWANQSGNFLLTDAWGSNRQPVIKGNLGWRSDTPNHDRVQGDTIFRISAWNATVNRDGIW